jgi:hypothetical protein
MEVLEGVLSSMGERGTLFRPLPRVEKSKSEGGGKEGPTKKRKQAHNSEK